MRINVSFSYKKTTNGKPKKVFKVIEAHDIDKARQKIMTVCRKRGYILEGGIKASEALSGGSSS